LPQLISADDSERIDRGDSDYIRLPQPKRTRLLSQEELVVMPWAQQESYLTTSEVLAQAA